jgi:hypothetical protein
MLSRAPQVGSTAYGTPALLALIVPLVAVEQAHVSHVGRHLHDSLDGEMQAALSALSNDDLTKTIQHGGFAPAVDVQLQIYLQALLIFFGKVTIYLRAMNRPLPQMIQNWIG